VAVSRPIAISVDAMLREVADLLAVDEVGQGLEDDAFPIGEGVGDRRRLSRADLALVEEGSGGVDFDEIGRLVGVVFLVLQTDIDLVHQGLVAHGAAVDALGDVATSYSRRRGTGSHRC